MGVSAWHLGCKCPRILGYVSWLPALAAAGNPAESFQLSLPCIDMLQVLVWHSFKTRINLYHSSWCRWDHSPCLYLWFCLHFFFFHSFAPVQPPTSCCPPSHTCDDTPFAFWLNKPIGARIVISTHQLGLALSFWISSRSLLRVPLVFSSIIVHTLLLRACAMAESTAGLRC